VNRIDGEIGIVVMDVMAAAARDGEQAL